jgi:hypothetical protein
VIKYCESSERTNECKWEKWEKSHTENNNEESLSERGFSSYANIVRAKNKIKPICQNFVLILMTNHCGMKKTTNERNERAFFFCLVVEGCWESVKIDEWKF